MNANCVRKGSFQHRMVCNPYLIVQVDAPQGSFPKHQESHQTHNVLFAPKADGAIAAQSRVMLNALANAPEGGTRIALASQQRWNVQACAHADDGKKMSRRATLTTRNAAGYVLKELSKRIRQRPMLITRNAMDSAAPDVTAIKRD
tara:strand:- start:802 stop:1239 length:438 start_codon:yes stop_codon:yes gene_type:complete